MVYGVKAIHPQHDFILVKRCEPPKVTPSGLTMVHAEGKEANHAIVVAAGPGRDGVPATVPKCKVGDVVLIDRFIGIKIDIDSVEHVMVKWQDIAAILELTESGEQAVKGE